MDASACVPIGSATQLTYVLQADDVNHRIEVSETAPPTTAAQAHRRSRRRQRRSIPRRRSGRRLPPCPARPQSGRPSPSHTEPGVATRAPTPTNGRTAIRGRRSARRSRTPRSRATWCVPATAVTESGSPRQPPTRQESLRSAPSQATAVVPPAAGDTGSSVNSPASPARTSPPPSASAPSPQRSGPAAGGAPAAGAAATRSQVRALLRGTLGRRPRSLSWILRHGGYTLEIKARISGRITIAWYAAARCATSTRLRRPGQQLDLSTILGARPPASHTAGTIAPESRDARVNPLRRQARASR